MAGLSVLVIRVTVQDSHTREEGARDLREQQQLTHLNTHPEKDPEAQMHTHTPTRTHTHTHTHTHPKREQVQCVTRWEG